MGYDPSIITIMDKLPISVKNIDYGEMVCVYTPMIQVGIRKELMYANVCTGNVDVYNAIESKRTDGMMFIPVDGLQPNKDKHICNGLWAIPSINLPAFLDAIEKNQETEMETALCKDTANVQVAIYKTPNKQKQVVYLQATRNIAVGEKIQVYYEMNYWLRCIGMGGVETATNKQVYAAQEYMIARCGGTAENGGNMQVPFIRVNCATVLFLEKEDDNTGGVLIRHPTVTDSATALFICCINTMYQRLKYMPTIPTDIMQDMMYRLKLESNMCNQPTDISRYRQQLLDRWEIQHKYNNYKSII